MMTIGNKVFDTEHKTYIMGILNITPDSFSDGGSYQTHDDILKRVDTMIAEGADIIDIGGESTRPGHCRISAGEEIERVVPVIESVKRRFDIPVSIDTYKAVVAKAAIASGADLVNDIWGLKYDREMAEVISTTKSACCLMHNRTAVNYQSFLEDCLEDLKESLLLAERAGIEKDKIIVDPGVGFAKTKEDNLKVIKELNRFKDLGYPVLLGTSRKSVIGLTLSLPVDQRVEGTIVTTVFSVLAGCSFVRVHDIRENKRAIMMAEAICAS